MEIEAWETCIETYTVLSKHMNLLFSNVKNLGNVIIEEMFILCELRKSSNL